MPTRFEERKQNEIQGLPRIRSIQNFIWNSIITCTAKQNLKQLHEFRQIWILFAQRHFINIAKLKMCDGQRRRTYKAIEYFSFCLFLLDDSFWMLFFFTAKYGTRQVTTTTTTTINKIRRHFFSFCRMNSDIWYISLMEIQWAIDRPMENSTFAHLKIANAYF